MDTKVIKLRKTKRRPFKRCIWFFEFGVRPRFV